MYNKELKDRYITEKRITTTVADYYFESLFGKTESFEIELDKDVSCFTAYEIINMYKTLSMSSLDMISATNSNLSMYTQWCIQENLVPDFQNHYLEITRSMMPTLLNRVVMDKKIVDRSMVIDWCGQMPNPSDSFCLLALFEGLKGSGYLEISNAKIDDFIEEEGNYYYITKNRKVKVSTKLIEYAELSNETLEYQSITHDMIRKTELVDNGKIIKDYPNVRAIETDTIMRRRIQSKLARIFDFLGVLDWMNGNDVRMSGIVFMINQRTKDLGISGQDYIYSKSGMKEIKDQFDFKIVPSVFYDKYNKYLV